MSLFDQLADIDATRDAIRSADSRVSFGTLCERACELRRGLEDARICLHLEAGLDAFALLAAADGRADTIALVSPRRALHDVEALISPIAPEVVVTGHAQRTRGSLSVFAGPAAAVAALAAQQKWLRPAPASQDTRWVLTTSGTTGPPKLVGHNLASLTRTIHCGPQQGAGQIWGLIYDYTRYAGLQVVLQSLLSGATLVIPPSRATLADAVHVFAEQGCTHLSATPTTWRRILMSPAAGALDLQQITLGGEIADQAVLDALSRAFPKARITHIYASTEAGVGFSVSDRRAGFPASYLESQPSGAALAIRDGRLWVRNTAVEGAYIGEDRPYARDGWIDTGDNVERRGERVYFRGRANGVINVGGNKVHPEEIERCLLSHPEVALARVYAKPSPITGSLVAAEIVPRDNSAEAVALRQSVLVQLRRDLERHMIPARLQIVDGFGVTDAGKLERKA